MSISGKWELIADTSMGVHNLTLTLKKNENKVSGELAGYLGTATFDDGVIEDDNLVWTITTKPMGKPITLNCSAKFEGDKIIGKMIAPIGLGLQSEYEFTGSYLGA